MDWKDKDVERLNREFGAGVGDQSKILSDVLEAEFDKAGWTIEEKRTGYNVLVSIVPLFNLIGVPVRHKNFPILLKAMALGLEKLDSIEIKCKNCQANYTGNKVRYCGHCKAIYCTGCYEAIHEAHDSDEYKEYKKGPLDPRD